MRESDKNLGATLNSIGDGVITTDLQGQIVSMNSIAEDLTGWKEEKAKGKAINIIYNIVNAKTREPVKNPVEKVLKQGKIIGLANHTTLIAKDGNEYQIADSGSPIKNKQDKITGVALVFRDVTEKYRIRQHLRQSEETYRTVFENTGAATIIIEEDTTISLVNKKFEELLGFSKQEVENRMSWMDFTSEQDLKKMKGYHYRRRLGDPKVPNRYETTIRDTNGEKHDVIIVIDMIPNTRKSIASFVDITELKEAQNKIHTQRKLLHKLNMELIKSQEEERKKISHELHDELGQNLTAISINLATIKKQVAENCSSKILERLEESISSVDSISDKIHEIVYQLRPSILDDLGLIRTVKWYVKQYKKRTNISVAMEISNIEKRLNPAIEILLYRVIQEGLTNITKHADANNVKIVMRKDSKSLKVIIADDGKGFDPEKLTKNPLDNSGLGITGIRERLLDVDGKLKIDSKIGKGTKLIVIIPKEVCK